MFAKNKRTRDLSVEEVQLGNRQWWTEHPMTYNWKGEIATPEIL